jgi:glycosyltransferase involved in cell wall biosynthesis
MKLTIITVVKNAISSVERCINSVQQQTYKNAEHLIVDGKSTDGTTELIQSLISRSGKIKIRHIVKKDSSLWEAMNTGISFSTGLYLCFLNSDDMFFDDDVLGVVQRKLINSNLDGVYGDVLIGEFYRNNLFKLKRKYSVNKLSIDYLRKGIMPPHPGCFISNNLINKAGGFSLFWKDVPPDFELFVILTNMKANIIHIPQDFVKMSNLGLSHRNYFYILTRPFRQYNALRNNHISANIFIIYFMKLRKLWKYYFKY